MATSAQYWRVNCTATGGNIITLADIAFYGVSGISAPISLVGGTASASSSLNGSTLPANAFDGNAGSLWASAAVPSTGTPQWIQYQFIGAVSVVFISIQINSDVNQFPGGAIKDFTIQSSPNGTTWTTQNTLIGYVWASAGATAYFDVSTTVGNLRVSQLPIEALVEGSNNTLVSQLNTEAILNAESNAKVTQLNFEAILNAQARVKISQMCLEVIYPNIPQTPKLLMQFLLP